MIISIIIAVDEQGGIGKDNRLPWRLSTDLKRFKTLTLGHTLVMGRKTVESIGKPLTGRTTILVTRNPDFIVEGCLIAHSLEDALQMAVQRGESEVFIAGGVDIFQQAFPLADRVYLTRVQAISGADRFFQLPDLTGFSEELHEDHPADEKNQFPFTFINLVRKK